jgi:hypothetical protein
MNYFVPAAIRLNVKVRADPHCTDRKRERADRLRRCRRLADNRQPVFITAKLASGWSNELLRYARAQYDFATFLLRSEVADDDIGLPPELIRPLTPALSAERYENFRDIDNELYDNLEPGGDGARLDG